jgi:predicted CXXCH cytochrome family protein
VLHGPTVQRKCDACHRLADPKAHRFSLVKPKTELCTMCHIQTQRTIVHKPVAEGNCTACHDPHGSNYRLLLVEDPAGGLCFRCHSAEQFNSKKYVHGPVSSGACVVCHNAHSSWRRSLLAKKDQELCLSCHADVMAKLRLYRHPHEPISRERCLRCHNPHASDHPAQLREGAPDLCFSCHEHNQTKRLVETSPRVHGAIRTEESCIACHAGHGSSMPKMLAKPLLSLCLSCHDQPLETPEGERLMDIATLLKDNPDHHGPVRRANCTACHNPHASPNFRLLAKEYPEMFYAPFDLKNYDLCFTCHLQELVTAQYGIGVTGFRQGELNLHYLHVNKEKKGRTCRACHEVHASKNPFHIREQVPFGGGGWEIKLNFQTLPDGGKCSPGCHTERIYSRRGPHEAGLTEPPDSTAETDQ